MPLNSHDAAFRRLEREVPRRAAPEPTVTEFRAVPEALQATVQQLHDLAQTWVTTRTSLTGNDIDPALLGGNTAPSNNPTLRCVLDRMEQSHTALGEAVRMLKAVAEHPR